MTETGNSAPAVDVAVIGSGVAGLTAAAQLARQGLSVGVFERSSHVGGRAMTTVRQGFSFNLGPHALYRGGAARRVFDQMGLRFSGSLPAPSGGYGLLGNERHTLPAGFVSLLTTKLLHLPAKLELAKLLGNIQKIDTAPIQGLSVNEWLAQAVRHEEVRRLVRALIRLSTYANAADVQSAGHALRQVQMAFKDSVEYLDGGWQTIVDALGSAARQAGATIRSGERVVAIEHDAHVQAVVLASGQRIPCSFAVLAVPPAEAAEALPKCVIVRRWSEESLPIRAACLDLGLSALSDPKALFALGIDRPLYFSVHSAAAKLAPTGGALIHIARYLEPTDKLDGKVIERELEGVADLMQPGWRNVLVEKQFLPNMMVYPRLVTAAERGTAGRPGPEVPGVANLYVAGDWVGGEGLLVDASVASAAAVAKRIEGRAGMVRRAA